MKYVKEFFHLNQEKMEELYTWKPSFGFNGYGEILYYRTYARKRADNTLESWHDTCLRVINGVMSIRKNHYIQNNIDWDEEYWQEYAGRMVESLFNMEWLPPGRGLWQCGTTFMYERGSAGLNNCGFTEVTLETMADDMAWSMDMLMVGVGIGYRLNNNYVRTEIVYPSKTKLFTVPDNREGWCNLIRMTIKAFTHGTPLPIPDCSLVRKKGAPIGGFGGIASGPGPLVDLYNRIIKEFKRYISGDIDLIELMANIANSIAVCVVAGNVRRSAEILQCEVENPAFIDLKNEALKPERLDISWTSNNSCIFTTKQSFNLISLVADRVAAKGEPGVINEMNLKYGRLSPKDIMAVENGLIRRDYARGFNPCGEQQLENRELCCLVNTFPTRCVDDNGYSHRIWLNALDFATFYATTITLLPTHDTSTNRVMQRNRRIGVALSDFTGWVHNEKLHNVINYLKEGYKTVKERNKELADEAGVPPSIRVTTVKPDGTITKLAGVTSGAGLPTFRHTLRRTRFPKNSPIGNALRQAGVPCEPDKMQPNTTDVFEYPILQGPSKPVSEASIWEQAANIVILQRYWSDNAVSNTIYFEPDEYNGIANPKSETHLIEQVISWMMPNIKSLSMLPKSGPGVYAQMPESELSEAEYNERLAAIKPIDWAKVTGNIATGEKFCSSDNCEI